MSCKNEASKEEVKSETRKLQVSGVEQQYRYHVSPKNKRYLTITINIRSLYIILILSEPNNYW